MTTKRETAKRISQIETALAFLLRGDPLARGEIGPAARAHIERLVREYESYSRICA